MFEQILLDFDTVIASFVQVGWGAAAASAQGVLPPVAILMILVLIGGRVLGLFGAPEMWSYGGRFAVVTGLLSSWENFANIMYPLITDIPREISAALLNIVAAAAGRAPATPAEYAKSLDLYWDVASSIGGEIMNMADIGNWSPFVAGLALQVSAQFLALVSFFLTIQERVGIALLTLLAPAALLAWMWNASRPVAGAFMKMCLTIAFFPMLGSGLLAVAQGSMIAALKNLTKDITSGGEITMTSVFPSVGINAMLVILLFSIGGIAAIVAGGAALDGGRQLRNAASKSYGSFAGAPGGTMRGGKRVGAAARSVRSGYNRVVDSMASRRNAPKSNKDTQSQSRPTPSSRISGAGA